MMSWTMGACWVKDVRPDPEQAELSLARLEPTPTLASRDCLKSWDATSIFEPHPSFIYNSRIHGTILAHLAQYLFTCQC